jgi:prevent-host-death family protein
MTAMPIAEAKARFSQLIRDVEQGRDVIVTRGAGKEAVAAVIPIAKYRAEHGGAGIRLGLAADWGVTAATGPDWELADDQLLGA